MRHRWEYAWVPILSDGSEWAPRSEEACDRLIAGASDPDHWSNEPWCQDLPQVTGKRRVRRLPATEWKKA